MTKHPSKAISVTLTCTYHHRPFEMPDVLKFEDMGRYVRLVSKQKVQVLDKWQMGDIRLSLRREVKKRHREVKESKP